MPHISMDLHIPAFTRLKHSRHDSGYENNVPGIDNQGGPTVANHDQTMESSEDESLGSDNIDTICYINIASQISHSRANLLYDSDDLASLLEPSPSSHIKRSHQSRHVAYPFHIRPASTTTTVTLPADPIRSLYAHAQGPTGYIYTPLSARSAGLESLRHDHGIRYARRVPCTALMLHWCDEDAAPTRLRERVCANVKRKKDRVKLWIGKKMVAFRKW